MKPATSYRVNHRMPRLSQTERERQETPFLFIHGTLTQGQSMTPYEDAFEDRGFSTHLRTYESIEEGQALEVSADEVSDDINRERLEASREALAELDRDNLAKTFGFHPDLHDQTSPPLDSIFEKAVAGVEEILEDSDEQLVKTFSSRTRKLEEQLTGEVERTGFGAWLEDPQRRAQVCRRVAGEIVHKLAPKAGLVGHSMGGFVAYAVTLNPSEGESQPDRFRFDGGNGVAGVLTLGSPVEKGVSQTLPFGLATLPYEDLEKTTFAPLEGTIGMRFLLGLPFVDSFYQHGKALTARHLQLVTEQASQMANPLIYARKPGFEQITEGSEFLQQHIEGKPFPWGATVVSASSALDGICEQHRAVLEEETPNIHNLDLDVPVTEEELRRPGRSLYTRTHVNLSRYPMESFQELRAEVFEDTGDIPRLLDISNNEGIRWNTLQLLMRKVRGDPGLLQLKEMGAIREAVEKVAEERIPFADSASAVAAQILKLEAGLLAVEDAPVCEVKGFF